MSSQRARRAADPDAEPDVPGYTVLGRIGRGAGSTVWSARDLDSGIVYALKVAAVPGGERAATAAHAEAREISLLRRLDHPHLVRLHRVLDLADGRRVLVLDLAEIGSLADLLDDRGPLCEGEVCWLLAPVAQALAHLHSRGVVHADVSTGNILLGGGARPMLGDLGVARLLPAVEARLPPAVEAESGAHETPGFGAPELAEGRPPTPASDIWSLGRVLQACLGEAAGSLSVLVAACTASDPGARPTAELVERVLRLTVLPSRPDPGPVPSIDRAATRPVAVAGPSEPLPEPRTRLRPTFRVGSRLGRFVAAGAILAGVIAAAAALTTATAVPRGTADQSDQGHHGDQADPVRAVQRLAAVRADVLSSGSMAGLAELDVSGSPAWRDDVRVLSSMSRSGIRLRGLRFVVTSARLVRWADDAAVVRTEIEVSAHERLPAVGTAQRVAASPSRAVDLVLVRDPEGHWRVRETVRTPDVQSAGSRRAD